MRLLSRWTLFSLLLLSTLPLASCGDTKKKFCDACSTDSECDANDALACQNFNTSTGGTVLRCAHPAALFETCPGN